MGDLPTPEFFHNIFRGFLWKKVSEMFEDKPNFCSSHPYSTLTSIGQMLQMSWECFFFVSRQQLQYCDCCLETKNGQKAFSAHVQHLSLKSDYRFFLNICEPQNPKAVAKLAIPIKLPHFLNNLKNVLTEKKEKCSVKFGNVRYFYQTVPELYRIA